MSGSDLRQVFICLKIMTYLKIIKSHDSFVKQLLDLMTDFGPNASDRS